MMNYRLLSVSIILFITQCSFPEDRKDNPGEQEVVHTGNASDTLSVDRKHSTTLTGADSARMVFNDDSSVSGTPSGRGTEAKGNAVGTGTSRPGENYPNPNHSNDSAYRK